MPFPHPYKDREQALSGSDKIKPVFRVTLFEATLAFTMTSTAPFLPFALPDIGDAEINEVVDTLRSGWVTTGPKARRFEEDFAAFLGDSALHCMAVNSATAGLHLALEALGLGPGDEVITTTHTFTATAEVVRYLGADVVLVDIDPATLCISPALIEAAITSRTKAIMPVHYAGLAADMPAILQIAQRHGLKVVEDAAHALPTTCAGQLVGTLASDVTVFSFYANKTITTGEGGMVVTRDAALAQRIKIMRLHGMSRDAFDRFTAKVPSWYYEIVAPGFKYNLTDIAAALGLQQLKRAHAFGQRRAEIAHAYNAAFAHLPVVVPPLAAAGDVHAWHLYVLRLSDAALINRDTLIEQLFAAGIGCSVHYIPLHLQPYWRDRYALRPEQFPHSQRAYERMLSLPLYSRMSDAEVQRVIAAVQQALG
jgi:dTDP-4-amino-4,6-dideoxygalactose transaminase